MFAVAYKYRSIGPQSLEFVSLALVWISNNKTAAKWQFGLWEAALELELQSWYQPVLPLSTNPDKHTCHMW